MREIILDTETTGLDPSKGHRIVEIGAIEISNLIPTGNVFHVYLDPERDIPEEAFRVHGLSLEFLSNHKKFREIADSFLDFIQESPLVIHNAEFDTRFLNAELMAIGLSAVTMDRVVDTLALARRRHPGQANSLDALCGRYGIDASRRGKHGALLDAGLLAEVYAELLGGRQATFALKTENIGARRQDGDLLRSRPAPLPSRLTPDEDAAHRRFAQTLGKASIWSRYLSNED